MDPQSKVKLEEVEHFAALQRTVRHRHRKDIDIGIKAILKLLLVKSNGTPMKVKEVAKQVTDIMNQSNQGVEFTQKTIQKRIYDVRLVLKAMGLIEENQKRMCYIDLETKFNVRQILKSRQSQELEKKKSCVQFKKQMVLKLRQYVNILRVFHKVSIKKSEETQQEQRIPLNRLVGIVMKKQDISTVSQNLFLFQEQTSHNCVVFKNPVKVIPNMQLVRNFIYKIQNTKNKPIND